MPLYEENVATFCLHINIQQNVIDCFVYETPGISGKWKKFQMSLKTMMDQNMTCKSKFIADIPKLIEFSRNSDIQYVFNSNKISNIPLTISDLDTWHTYGEKQNGRMRTEKRKVPI